MFFFIVLFIFHCVFILGFFFISFVFVSFYLLGRYRCRPWRLSSRWRRVVAAA